MTLILMNKIIILSGPIKSGKTTFLMKHFKDRGDVAGFLCPDVNHQRFFFDLDKKEWTEFEVHGDFDSSTTINIGKYSFRSEVFLKAKMIIDKTLSQSYSFFIIDEIGKLELMGEGLEPELYRMLHQTIPNIKTLILVVRDYLLDEVTKKYNLYDANVVQIDNKVELQKLLNLIPHT